MYIWMRSLRYWIGTHGTHDQRQQRVGANKTGETLSNISNGNTNEKL